MRRHVYTSVVLSIIVALGLGIAYPLAMTGVGRLVFPWRTNGSFVKQSRHEVGSALLGQEFLDAKGNPDPKYFQPRPSAAGSGYDPQASSASNLGPGDPRLVGFIPGFNSVGLDGSPSKTNPFATKEDPYCVPTDDAGDPVTSPSGGQKYTKVKGAYVCDTNTVPQRVIAYRALTGIPASTKVPVDAVTASGSGLDPQISVANARLQAPAVAKARNLPLATVLKVVSDHTASSQLGFLGEKGVTVLTVNIALDALHS